MVVLRHLAGKGLVSFLGLCNGAINHVVLCCFHL